MKSMIFACALAFAAPAFGQGNPLCGPSDAVYEGLDKNWQEARVFSGLDDRGSVIEVFANEETGTWTLLMTNSAGVSCQVGAGQGGILPDAVPNI